MSGHVPVRDEIIYDLHKAVIDLQEALLQLWTAAMNLEMVDMAPRATPGQHRLALGEAMATYQRCRDELDALQAIFTQWAMMVEEQQQQKESTRPYLNPMTVETGLKRARTHA